jgi:hypothetical protein
MVNKTIGFAVLGSVFSIFDNTSRPLITLKNERRRNKRKRTRKKEWKTKGEEGEGEGKKRERCEKEEKMG